MGNFWACQRDEIGEKYEKDIFMYLNHPKADRKKFTHSSIKIGDMCIAPYFVNNDFWFYRGRIEALSEDFSDAKVKLFT